MKVPAVLRILLVEDSPTDVLLISEAFAAIPGFDYELVTAEYLQDGLKEVQTSPIDVVLLDLGLPDSNGIDTFRTFLQRSPNLPVLVLTALDNIDVGLKALSEGAQDYLIKKDIQAPVLGRAVRYAIERNELHLELKLSRDRLRKLTAHLQTAREQERTRISREIHDELGQKMSALKMDLHWLYSRLEKMPESAQRQELETRIHESEALVEHVIETVQKIAIELRPSVLDHLGLVDAIRDESRRFEANTGIHVALKLEDSLATQSPEISTTFFRIYQELLTNIVRHAQAKNVQVELNRQRDGVALDVTDDGIGIPDNINTLQTSLGLLGIQERAASHGGRVYFSGEVGRGTHVAVKIPDVELEGVVG